MRDQAFCINCGAHLNSNIFPSSLIFVCGVCETPFCISVHSDYKKDDDDDCAAIVRLAGENLEWTEVSEDAIVSVIFYKNYLPIPIILLNLNKNL